MYRKEHGILQEFDSLFPESLVIITEHKLIKKSSELKKAKIRKLHQLNLILQKKITPLERSHAVQYGVIKNDFLMI